MMREVTNGDGEHAPFAIAWNPPMRDGKMNGKDSTGWKELRRRGYRQWRSNSEDVPALQGAQDMKIELLFFRQYSIC